MGRRGILDVLRVDPGDFRWLSQLFWDWIDGRSTLWVVRVSLLFNLVTLCSLEDIVILLLVFFLSSLDL